MLKANYIIKCFGDVAAYRLYVCMLHLLQGGRSTESTDLPATDATYTMSFLILRVPCIM